MAIRSVRLTYSWLVATLVTIPIVVHVAAYVAGRCYYHRKLHLNRPISAGGNYCGMLNVGHTNFLVEVGLTWVQDPGSSSKFS